MVTGLSKYFVPRENNQNDDSVSLHNILLCLIQYLTRMHAGYFKDLWRMLSQQRMHIFKQCLYSSYSYHNYNVRIKNTLILINTFYFRKLNILQICNYIYLVILHIQRKPMVGSNLTYYKLIILFFLTIKFKSIIKHIRINLNKQEEITCVSSYVNRSETHC